MWLGWSPNRGGWRVSQRGRSLPKRSSKPRSQMRGFADARGGPCACFLFVTLAERRGRPRRAAAPGRRSARTAHKPLPSRTAVLSLLIPTPETGLLPVMFPEKKSRNLVESNFSQLKFVITFLSLHSGVLRGAAVRLNLSYVADPVTLSTNRRWRAVSWLPACRFVMLGFCDRGFGSKPGLPQRAVGTAYPVSPSVAGCMELVLRGCGIGSFARHGCGVTAGSPRAGHRLAGEEAAAAPRRWPGSGVPCQ